ncbi:MAG: PCRF domain-containing protein, partial [Chloroflexota bacterium]|nr:PCRF domain-containing protein [Chloroflexota bacterium]
MAGKEKEIASLEAQSARPDFWQDPLQAQATMRRLAELRKLTQRWREMEKKIADVADLMTLAREEKDASLEAEIQSEIEKMAVQLDDMELEMAFSGPYDARNAILAVHAGAGGTESQDWAGMLMRMYLRWAERRGYKAEILDMSPSEEAGVKSVVINISGQNAVGYLKSEHG